MLQQGVGYTVNNSSGGQSLVVDFPRSEITQAFFAYEDIKDDASEAIIRITPGTINLQFPKINGIQIGLPTAFLTAPTENSVIVITIPNSSSAFPSGVMTISLFPLSGVPTSDNDNCRLSLAQVIVETQAGGSKSYTIQNLLRGSLSGTRYSDNVGQIVYLFNSY